MALIIAQALKNKEGDTHVENSGTLTSTETEVLRTVSGPDDPDAHSDQRRPSSGAEIMNTGNYLYCISWRYCLFKTRVLL